MMNFSRGAYLMAIQKLVQSTHPVLTKQAQPIKAYDATLKDLLLDNKNKENIKILTVNIHFVLVL